MCTSVMNQAAQMPTSADHIGKSAKESSIPLTAEPGRATERLGGVFEIWRAPAAPCVRENQPLRCDQSSSQTRHDLPLPPYDVLRTDCKLNRGQTARAARPQHPSAHVWAFRS